MLDWCRCNAGAAGNRVSADLKGAETLGLEDFSMLELDDDQMTELFEPGAGNTMSQGLVMDRFQSDIYLLEEDLDGYPETRYDTADRTDIPFDGVWTDAEEIHIGAAVTSVSSALWEAPCVERFTVSSRNPVFFVRDGVLFRRNERGEIILVKYPPARKDETYAIPEDVTQIDVCAFQETEHLKHLISTSVLRMDRPFHEMDALETLRIENAVSMTGCFDWCMNLREISLPDTLLEIDDCFCECPALKGTLEIPASLVRFNDSFLNSGIEGFSGESAGCKTDDGVLFSKDGTRLIRYPNTKVAKCYPIPDGVEVIESHAFSGSQLREVSLPTSVREIRNDAFRKSENLVTIYVRDGHLSDVRIHDYAFEDTKWIDSQGQFAVFEDVLVSYRGEEESEIRLPAVRAIAEGAFHRRPETITVSLADRTKRIESRAFMYNDEIVALDLASVEEIESEAFVGISAEKVVIPDFCKGIGKHAFLNAKTRLFVIEGAETQFGEECIGFKRAFGEPVEENPDTFVLCWPGSTAQEYCIFYGIRYEHLKE